MFLDTGWKKYCYQSFSDESLGIAGFMMLVWLRMGLQTRMVRMMMMGQLCPMSVQLFSSSTSISSAEITDGVTTYRGDYAQSVTDRLQAGCTFTLNEAAFLMGVINRLQTNNLYIIET